MGKTVQTNGHIKELSPEEGMRLFDNAAKYYLEISGQEFLERLNTGEFNDPDVDPDVAQVLALVPFARS